MSLVAELGPIPLAGDRDDIPASHNFIQVQVQSDLKCESLLTQSSKASPHVDSNVTNGSSNVVMTSYTTVHYVDRTQILTESWLEAANVVILLSGFLSALVATFFFAIDIHPSLQKPWAFCLLPVYVCRLIPRLNSDDRGSVLGIPPPAMCLEPTAMPLSVRTRALWLTSLGTSLGCVVLATLLKKWMRQQLLRVMIRPWPGHRPQRRDIGINMHPTEAGSLEVIFHALHAWHLVSVFLFLLGLGLYLLRGPNPPSVLVVTGLSAMFFFGQCFIVSAFPRVNRRSMEAIL